MSYVGGKISERGVSLVLRDFWLFEECMILQHEHLLHLQHQTCSNKSKRCLNYSHTLTSFSYLYCVKRSEEVIKRTKKKKKFLLLFFIKMSKRLLYCGSFGGKEPYCLRKNGY